MDTTPNWELLGSGGTRELLRATPCGCPECDERVQAGHFACSPSPDWALRLERTRWLTRSYNGTSWVWEPGRRLLDKLDDIEAQRVF